MPDPVKAPPRTLVGEFEAKLKLELSNIANDKKKKARRKAKLKEVCKRLAYIQAFLKYNGIEVK